MPERVVGLPVDTLLDVDEVTMTPGQGRHRRLPRADYKPGQRVHAEYMFGHDPEALVEEVVKDATSFPPEIGRPSSKGAGNTIRVRC
jgi:hypothetical protein